MQQVARRIWAGLAAALISYAINAQEMRATPVAFSVEPQPLYKALNAWATQAGVNLIWPDGDEAEQVSPRLIGKFLPAEALRLLLKGSRLEYAVVDARTVEIRPSRRDAVRRTALLSPANPGPGETASWLASAENATVGVAQERQADVPHPPLDHQELEEVVVTGSHIQGAPAASPIQVYDREQIARSGYTNVQDFLVSLPQLSGGGSSETMQASRLQSSRSLDYSSAPNLRGLGSEATLTLVNGHRMAAAGLGTITDVSMIPLSAIERIEVVADGSSAIYGSDAVAGVVNILLKKGYAGAESLAEYGSVTDGSHSVTRLSQSLGHAWSSGDALLSYDYSYQTALATADRQFGRESQQFFLGDLAPRTKRQSVFAAGHQKLSDRLDLSVNGLFSNRRARANSNIEFPEGGSFASTQSDQYAATADLDFRMSESWNAVLSGSWGKNTSDGGNFSRVDPSLQSDGSDTTSRLSTIDLVTSGSVVNVPAGAVRTALGIAWREEHARTIDTVAQSQFFEGTRQVKSIFAEIVMPIFGAANSAPFVRELTLTAAGRHDDYSDFGAASVPKFGLHWRPVDSLVIRGTASKSFRAPPFVELGSSSAAYGIPLADPAAPSESTNGLLLLGSNPFLKPERAKSFTAGLDFAPPDLAALRISTTWFQTNYRGRIAAPNEDPFAILTDPATYSNYIVRNPSQSLVQETAAAQSVFFDLGVPLSDVAVIVDARVANVAITKVEGIDATFTYSLDTPAGFLDLSTNLSYLLGFDQQPAPDGTAVSLLNTTFNPPRMKSRVDGALSRGRLQLSAAVNYVGDYTDATLAPRGSIRAFTTFDLRVAYGIALLADTTIALSAVNVFDKMPQAIGGNALTGFGGYDAVNASPRGRFISAQIQKRW